jgi:hypothetical protein
MRNPTDEGGTDKSATEASGASLGLSFRSRTLIIGYRPTDRTCSIGPTRQQRTGLIAAPYVRHRPGGPYRYHRCSLAAALDWWSERAGVPCSSRGLYRRSRTFGWRLWITGAQAGIPTDAASASCTGRGGGSSGRKGWRLSQGSPTSSILSTADPRARRRNAQTAATADDSPG